MAGCERWGPRALTFKSRPVALDMRAGTVLTLGDGVWPITQRACKDHGARYGSCHSDPVGESAPDCGSRGQDVIVILAY